MEGVGVNDRISIPAKLIRGIKYVYQEQWNGKVIGIMEYIL